MAARGPLLAVLAALLERLGLSRFAAKLSTKGLDVGDLLRPEDSLIADLKREPIRMKQEDAARLVDQASRLGSGEVLWRCDLGETSSCFEAYTPAVCAKLEAAYSRDGEAAAQPLRMATLGAYAYTYPPASRAANAMRAHRLPGLVGLSARK